MSKSKINDRFAKCRCTLILWDNSSCIWWISISTWLLV